MIRAPFYLVKKRQPEWLTITEAARRVNVTYTILNHHLHLGYIPYYKTVATKRFVTVEDLKEYATKQGLSYREETTRSTNEHLESPSSQGDDGLNHNS